jgi:hypothetical protein
VELRPSTKLAELTQSEIQFTSIIVGSFGFDTLGTQYLQVPGGAIQFIALLGGGFICSRFPNTRCIVMIVANCICILGAAMLVGLPASNKWGRLVGLWLCYFQGLGFSMSLTMVSSNVAGYTKKQCTGTILFVGYCVGNIIGKSCLFLFPSSISIIQIADKSHKQDHKHSEIAKSRATTLPT